MDEVLKKILENELLSEDSKKEITEAFSSILTEAKEDQDKVLREEFTQRYETDKAKIAEAVEQYVNQKMEQEIVEFHSDLKALGEQRIKYVNAQQKLKEQAQQAIKSRLAIFEKALGKALLKETKELHADLKTNRSAMVRTMTEAKAQAETDRQSFRTKGAKVLEHIINVKLQSHLNEMKADIDKAKENDFGARIYEAFMGEARRMFFSSHKELRNLMKQLTEQSASFKKEKAVLMQKVNESQEIARKAIKQNNHIKESVIREKKMNQLLTTIPNGMARSKMKTLLETSATADLDKTFKKYASNILTEAKIRPVDQSGRKINMTEATIRTGDGLIQVDEDDQEIVQLRQLAGIPRR